MSQAGVFASGSGPGGQDLHVAQFIVCAAGTSGTGANYTTIGAAIAAAPAGSSIFIQPGTYIEALTITKSLNFFGSFDNQLGFTVLQGSMTISGVSVALNGLRISDNGGTLITVSGGSQTNVLCQSMEFLTTNVNTMFSYTNSNSSSNFTFQGCIFSVGASGAQFFNSSSPGNLLFYYSLHSGNGNAASTISSGFIGMYYCEFSTNITTSGSASLAMFHSEIGNGGALSIGTINLNGSGFNEIFNSLINSSANTAVIVNSPSTISNTIINCTNPTAAISGTSILSFNTIEFANSGDLITTSTITPLQTQAGGLKLYGGFSENYTNQTGNYLVGLNDGIVGVNSGSPCTITMPTPNSGQFVGQNWTIKDESGTAGSVNITVSGNGVNIDNAATFTIGNNYGALRIYWNGTQYYIE